ncbi:TIGR02680 family protein [Fervidibacillus halotolerans]|uniref:TIGR02680 family protein n=1 Tax=Fervidibacillus halotolerans TaxID=2980027 RepID=A0A9E8LYJ0_9BACI|nr:TIGR02680 family protein [Fervidibacillus halotolerans]WAA12100.1 TIGR02680 family protein [Fervidibacillus halotolerans]
MKNAKWVPNRAGLFNFWYYDDEILPFSEGKMLLRGANGSGKSVTMQSFIPILLDGKKTPDRLDPFGSRARRMEDYLIGEKEVVDRDERTGYLFIEYKKEATNQYMTTGIGMQAKRNKGLKSWYFIIKDNRRIGIDFSLYQKQFGEKIPLSAKELENRIGAGGFVVHTQKEYMELVNKYIFGFSSLEAFDDLIKLLIQLRSPKLSKDFRPTVIYEILESALPPLTDDELRHLSDTIDNMDQTRQQLEQLEREYASVQRLKKVYDSYNKFIFGERAKQWWQAEEKKKAAEENVRHLEKQASDLQLEIEQLENEQIRWEQKKSFIEQEKENLSNHEVWSLEKRKEDKQREINRQQEYILQLEKKQDELNEKLRKAWNERQEKESSLLHLTKRKENLLDELADEGQLAAFSQHEINEESFHRTALTDFDFTIWIKEAKEHQKLLNEMGRRVERIEQLHERHIELQRKSSKQKFVVDELQKEKDHLEQWFEEEHQKLETVIFQWIEDHPKLEFAHTEIQHLSRLIQGLYEETRFEEVRERLYKAILTYEGNVKGELDATERKMEEKKREIEEAEEELQRIKSQKMLDPERSEGTERFRTKLQEEGTNFLPFYAAVEFRDHVTEDERERIESTLKRVGILDSLITDTDVTPEEDAVFIPEPKLLGYTLADYLMPDLDENSSISSAKVDEVLRSIPLDRDETGFHIDVDGTYSIGCLVGHAPFDGPAKFIGRSSRKRHQQEQIRIWSEKIAELEKELAQLEEIISELQSELNEIGQWKQDLPKDDFLQDLYRQISHKKQEIELAQNKLSEIDDEWKKVHANWSSEKKALKEMGRHLNIVLEKEPITKAYEAANMYLDRLYELRNVAVQIVSIESQLDSILERIKELEEDLDKNKGEQNVKTSEIYYLKEEVKSIERQLQMKGIDEVRTRIQQVLTELKEAVEQLEQIHKTIPRQKSKQERVQEKLEEARTDFRFWENMTDAWRLLVEKEKERNFFDVEIDNPKTLYEAFEKEYTKYEKAKILELLTKSYYSEQDYLTEYRMVEYMEEVETPDWFREDFGVQYEPLIAEWKNSKGRKLIELDYFGMRVSPYFVANQLEEELEKERNLLDEQDRQLYEDIILNTVGKILRTRIQRAELWVKQMDQIMKERDTSSGLTFSIAWKPLTADSEDELDTKDLVQLLQRNSKFLSEEDLEKITKHFRSRIAKAKELIELRNEGNTLHQVLKEVLDYRKWFTFILYYKRAGEPKRELTNNAFYRFSGGEKAMAMYIPLFTAAYSRYKEAAESAPYIISLDEAFAGVDENNIRDMFEVVETLGFDYIMNSQSLWGDYDTISSLSICELIRPKNADYVTVIRYHWDGKKRTRIEDTFDEEIFSES